jgi:hypothetical protein
VLQKLIPSLEGYTVSYLHALVFRWIVIGLMIALVIFAVKSVLLADIADGVSGTQPHSELVSL